MSMPNQEQLQTPTPTSSSICNDDSRTPLHKHNVQVQVQDFLEHTVSSVSSEPKVSNIANRLNHHANMLQSKRNTNIIQNYLKGTNREAVQSSIHNHFKGIDQEAVQEAFLAFFPKVPNPNDPIEFNKMMKEVFDNEVW